MTLIDRDEVMALVGKWRREIEQQPASGQSDYENGWDVATSFCADQLEALAAKDDSVPHPDDVAVDLFASAMKAKLEYARNKGRRGWQDKAGCPQQRLSDMLHAHAAKGDPVDVANFACFLWNRQEGILAKDGAQQAGPYSIESYTDKAGNKVTVHTIVDASKLFGHQESVEAKPGEGFEAKVERVARAIAHADSAHTRFEVMTEDDVWASLAAVGKGYWLGLARAALDAAGVGRGDGRG